MTTNSINENMISIVGNAAIVTTPYHPSFAGYARQLGGRWLVDKRVWSFDARDVGRVRNLLLDMFGTDGNPTELVTLRVVCDSSVWDKCGGDLEMWLAGRLVAKTLGRDATPRLGSGVVVVAGKGFASGGSRKNPEVQFHGGTIFELRDVPLRIAKRVADAHPKYITVESSIMSPPPEQIDTKRVELLTERAVLAARLAEIDRELSRQPADVKVTVPESLLDEQ